MTYLVQGVYVRIRRRWSGSGFVGYAKKAPFELHEGKEQAERGRVWFEIGARPDTVIDRLVDEVTSER